MKRKMMMILLVLSLLCSNLSVSAAGYNSKGNADMYSGDAGVSDAIMKNLTEYIIKFTASTTGVPLSAEDYVKGELRAPIEEALGESWSKVWIVMDALDASKEAYADLILAYGELAKTQKEFFQTSANLAKGAMERLAYAGSSSYELGKADRYSTAESPYAKLDQQNTLLNVDAVVNRLKDNSNDEIWNYYGKKYKKKLVAMADSLRSVANANYTAYEYYNLGRYGETNALEQVGINPENWPVLNSYTNARSGYVAELQQFLNLYMNAGLEIDSSYGPATQEAVKRYQQQKGLEMDSSCGPKTKAQIINDFNTVAPINPENWPVMNRKINNTNLCVKELQRFLNKNMNAGLVIEASYGPATVQAVKEYQKKKGLAQDGSCGDETRQQILYDCRN